MVSFHQVSKHYGGHDVLSDVSFQINPGDKVGLIGANGAGKSTVVHLLLGVQRPGAGSVVVGPDLKIGHVPQQLEAPPEMRVRDFLLGEVAPVEEALRDAERALAEAADRQMANALQRYQSARDRHDAAGGDQAGWQADRVLQHVGLTHAGAATVGQLSGGERNLLALARALMMDPGLLVLDEPGNHLDYAGLEWLEEALVNFAGAVLLVSHNRRLLDRTVTRILELKGGRVRRVRGQLLRLPVDPAAGTGGPAGRLRRVAEEDRPTPGTGRPAGSHRGGPHRQGARQAPASAAQSARAGRDVGRGAA